jgi:hypothetical protein
VEKPRKHVFANYKEVSDINRTTLVKIYGMVTHECCCTIILVPEGWRTERWTERVMDRERWTEIDRIGCGVAQIRLGYIHSYEPIINVTWETLF